MTGKRIAKGVLVVASCFCVAAAASGPAGAASSGMVVDDDGKRVFRAASRSADAARARGRLFHDGDAIMYSARPRTLRRVARDGGATPYGRSSAAAISTMFEAVPIDPQSAFDVLLASVHGGDLFQLDVAGDFHDSGVGVYVFLVDPLPFPWAERFEFASGDVVTVGRDYAVASVPLPWAVVLMASAIAALLGFGRGRFGRRGRNEA